MTGERVSFQDRLVAEAVRRLESDRVRPVEDGKADETAIDAGGPFERRLAVRARTMEAAGPLVDALGRVRQGAVFVALFAVILGFVAGAAAARATLGGDDDHVNIFWVLITLFSVQTVLLLGWLAMMTVRPAALAGRSLGGIAVAIGQRLSARLHRSGAQAIAVDTTSAVLSRTPIGRWTLGSISHAIWLAFNVGCAVLLVLMLSARSYTFGWETTILSKDTYVPLTQAIGVVPEALGFAVPDEAQIIGSQDSGDPAASEAWSGLLLGSIVAYGFLPRLLLLLLCLAMRARACGAFRLDVNHPGFERLRSRLMPSSRSLGIVDPTDGVPVPRAARAAEGPMRPAGPPAVVGFELPVPATHWPPRVAGVQWTDLGFVEDRAGRERVVRALRDSAEEPEAVVVVCALTTTPDRGVRRFLEEVQGAVARPISVLLTSGQRFREDADPSHVEDRVGDWVSLATTMGLADDRVIELDLDHATERSLGRLATLVNGDGEAAAAAPVARLDEAFAVIAGRVRGWTSSPSVETQAELHRSIGAVYREDATSWRRLLDGGGDVGDLPAQLKRGAEKVTSILPEQLRVDPRWMAAGALTGALGCVAAATLLSPVAIGSLPVWSGLGGVIGGLITQFRGGRGEQAADGNGDDATADAIRSATLFAVLLELQGRDEASISRVLERTFDGAGDVRPTGVAAFLDETRHRLELALAAEGAA